MESLGLLGPFAAPEIALVACVGAWFVEVSCAIFTCQVLVMKCYRNYGFCSGAGLETAGGPQLAGES